MPASIRKDNSTQSSHTIVPRPRGRPKLEDVAEIENGLLRAALDEFLRSGYAGASMRSIAKAAGFSRSTLLSRFSSKEDLFGAIMTQQITGMSVMTALPSPRGQMDVRDGLKAYANRALEFSLEGDLLDVNRLICSESHRFPELGAAADRSTRLGIAQVSEFIRQCGKVNGVEYVDPAGLAEAFVLMVRGWYLNVMMTNRPVTVPERKQWVERSVNALNVAIM